MVCRGECSWLQGTGPLSHTLLPVLPFGFAFSAAAAGSRVSDAPSLSQRKAERVNRFFAAFVLQGKRPAPEQRAPRAGAQLAGSVALPPGLGLAFLKVCLEMEVEALGAQEGAGGPFPLRADHQVVVGIKIIA